MVVRFKIATSKDVASFIFELKDSLRGSEERTSPCIKVNLPMGLKKKLLSASVLSERLSGEIETAIGRKIKKNRTTEESFLKDLKKIWKKIEKKYFKKVEILMGVKPRKEYVCYVTSSTCGMYLEPNTVVLNCPKNYKIFGAQIAYVLAEEILHLVYWRCWSNIFRIDSKKVDPWDLKGVKWNAWHVSELIPEYVLVNNPAFKEWSLVHREKDYPWINVLKKIADPLWKGKKNFNSFLIALHKKLGICLDRKEYIMGKQEKYYCADLKIKNLKKLEDHAQLYRVVNG